MQICRQQKLEAIEIKTKFMTFNLGIITPVNKRLFVIYLPFNLFHDILEIPRVTQKTNQN